MKTLRPRRRLFLGATFSVAVQLAYPHIGYSKTDTRGQAFTATLKSVVDTIIPADEFPGALSLGLDKQALNLMSTQPINNASTYRLMDLINHMALASYRRKFHKLDQDDRETFLIELLSSSAPRQVRVMLSQFRALIMSWYYKTPDGQESLGYLLPSNYKAYVR